MVLNIVSTVSGMENEGMRNIASHMIRELEKKCTVRKSALDNPLECVKNSIAADAVLIFARASAKTGLLAKILQIFCRKIYFILVQKPEPAFMDIIGNRIDRFSYFTILPKDGAELESKGATVRTLEVGINLDKFRPASSRDEVLELRRKYGFAEDVPLVLHVGHLSEGRGLEEFLHLPKEKYQRFIVASGMFTSAEVEEKLRCDGVSIIKEYLPDVSEVYRMADVYLFPTKSAEFVISIPLSVTEALACGTPVVSFCGVDGIDQILTVRDDALVKIKDSAELETAVTNASKVFLGNHQNLLKNMGSWANAADKLLYNISGDN